MPRNTGGVRIGDLIGPYQVLRLLGRGGMGEVYLARSPAGRPVAVKTLRSDGPLDATQRKRFAREIALARRVNGAYTADVIDADADAEVPWMATEYIGAPSLVELVQQCGVLPPEAIWWIAAGVTEALGTLHAAGIVHRDLKPSNILLPADGPRLIDFGISHARDLTRTEITLGTIAFASPEQARGEPTSPASDVFALGATLFYLATGRPPYPPSEPLQLLVRVAEGTLELAGLPEAVAPVVLACLRHDPAERTPLPELLRLLTEHLDARPEAVGGAPWLPPSWRERIAGYAERASAAGGPATPTTPAAGADGADRPVPLPPAEATTARIAPHPPTLPDVAPFGPVPPPAPAPAARARRVRLAAVASLVVASVAVFTYAATAGSSPSEDPGQAERATSTVSDAPDSPSGSPSDSRPPLTPLYTPKEEITARPVTEFVDVAKGDCVDLAGSDDPNVAIFEPWTKEELDAVPCSSRTAYMQVTDVRWGEDQCPRGGGLGQFSTQHAYVNPVEISVCLQRRFRVGQCFPGLVAQKEADSRSQLLAVQPCRKSELSQLNNTMFQITGLHQGTSRSSSDRCGPGSYYWVLEERDMVLCATAL
ncbi:hypothetical protein AQ490_19215 [Wenjunlia vitaminophila]|uniref:Protein kinase domain-containing protein n=1 Tax=Wenjunlia vitaminophila TaxID=76728 RepID=A0A0T6LUP7_WENVI|nr:serine/threonine-protein kinase [Wenjunlia vitaminophila]KRV49819.1 hypothetical protein AQ490_19215 [Wenjunlia vitaminophila]